MSDITFTPDNVIDLRQHLVDENDTLIERLAIVGRTPTPEFFRQQQLDALLELLFDDEESLTLYQTTLAKNINQKLKHELANVTQALVAPSTVS